MALFDSLGAALVGVMGAIYPDGTLWRPTVTEAENGDSSVTFAPEAVKVQQDDCTEAMRGQEGYTDKDVRLIILMRNGTTVIADPTTDCQVTAAGRRWSISNISADPVSSHWVMRGTPV